MQNLQKTLQLLDLEKLPRLTLCDVTEFQDAHIPPFAPDLPALLLNPQKADFHHLCKILQTVYDDRHKIRLLLDDDCVTDVDLGLLGSHKTDAPVSAILIPPLPKGTSLTAFAEIVAHLRAPDGCPWDKKQTHQSLIKDLLEEVYEVIEAVDKNDAKEMEEEFGDLLLHIVLNSQIAAEYKEFRLSDVLKGVYDKIVYRHPHVFGSLQVDGQEEVKVNWQILKAKERKKKGKQDKGILDGVPRSLPALSQAYEYQARAADVNFDWDDITGVLDKLNEEIEEIHTAETQTQLEAEIGDLFFVLVNFARWKKVDSESALRKANQRFKVRFAYIEQCARDANIEMNAMSLAEMEACWQEAKRKGL